MKKTILLTSLISFSAFAEVQPILYQYYINGINTTKQEAEKNLVKINENLKFQNSVQGTFISKNISLLYNEKPSPIDAGVFKQILDSIRQKKQEWEKLTIEDIVDNVMTVYGYIYPIDSEEYKKLTISVKKSIDELYSPIGFNFEKIVTDFELQSGLTNFSNMDDKYFIIIAHSQGNLYANELIGYFNAKNYDNKEHFAELSIATPASVVNGFNWNSYGYEQRYVTSYYDIINRVPNALNSNIFLGEINPNDPNSHSLIDTYFYFNESKSQIIKKYADMLEKFSEYIRQNISNIGFNTPTLNYIESEEKLPYWDKKIVDSITRYVFLEEDKYYNVYSLVSNTQPMYISEIHTNKEVLNEAYTWHCTSSYDPVTDYVTWSNCYQCTEINNFKITGISGCSNNTPLLKSFYSKAGDDLVLSGTIKNNTSILSNKIKILP